MCEIRFAEVKNEKTSKTNLMICAPQHGWVTSCDDRRRGCVAVLARFKRTLDALPLPNLRKSQRAWLSDGGSERVASDLYALHIQMSIRGDLTGQRLYLHPTHLRGPSPWQLRAPKSAIPAGCGLPRKRTFDPRAADDRYGVDGRRRKSERKLILGPGLLCTTRHCPADRYRRSARPRRETLRYQ
jgi:hypothetical protein